MTLSPKWYPVTVLPGLIKHMDERLIGDQKQLDALVTLKTLPWSLDVSVVDQLIDVYTSRKDTMTVFAEQHDCWKKNDERGAYREQLQTLAQKIQTVENLRSSILNLAYELKKRPFNPMPGNPLAREIEI